jgi:hypothetical protein
MHAEIDYAVAGAVHTCSPLYLGPLVSICRYIVDGGFVPVSTTSTVYALQCTVQKCIRRTVCTVSSVHCTALASCARSAAQQQYMISVCIFRVTRILSVSMYGCLPLVYSSVAVALVLTALNVRPCFTDPLILARLLLFEAVHMVVAHSLLCYQHFLTVCSYMYA